MIRHSNSDVQLGLNTLMDMGVLTESGLESLGQLARSLQSLSIGGAPVARRGRPVGRPAGKKRGKRGRLSLSDAELAKLYVTQDKTAKEIAAMFGVSPGTVAVRASKLGLKKRGGAKKKTRKRAATRKRRSKKRGKK